MFVFIYRLLINPSISSNFSQFYSINISKKNNDNVLPLTFENKESIEKLHLQFCRNIFKVRSTTPNYMAYGELGIYPMEVMVKCKIILFWNNLLCKSNKLSSILYKLMFKLHDQIRHILNGFLMLNQFLMILAWVLYGMIQYPWKEMFWKTWYLQSWTINLYKNGFRRWTILPEVYFIQNIKGDLV